MISPAREGMAMASRKFRVYLAGPISGCNEQQMHAWRQEVVSKWGSDFEFIDPTGTLVPAPEAACLEYQIVEKDQRAIQDADGVIANMWRESIGTAIGIVHARAKGRPVVVVDPNLIDSRIVRF